MKLKSNVCWTITRCCFFYHFFSFQLDIVVAEDIFPVMVKDGLVTSHPVSPKLNHPDEIAESFDQISYNKVSHENCMTQTYPCNVYLHIKFSQL